MLWLLLLLVVPAQAGSGLVDVGEVEISDSPQEAVALAAKALQEHRFDDAAALYAALAASGGKLQARYWEGLARYEGGDLRGARKALEEVVAGQPDSLPAANLLGLILVDGGSVEAGIARLEAVRAKAEAKGDQAILARSLVNLGLARLDQGNAGEAGRLLNQALELGKSLNDQGVIDGAQQSLAALAALAGTDNGVGRLLGKGDVRGARSAAEQAKKVAVNRRERVEAAILLAAVERTEGNVESAIGHLGTAAKEARIGGLTREQAMALGQLGIAQSVAGRHALAADALQAGVAAAHEGGYRVVEVDLRCELGIVLTRLDRLEDATAQLQAAGVLLGGMDYSQGQARQAELSGMIAAGKGDLATATSALARAVSYSEQLGRPLDAARAATGLAGALEPTAPAEADRWQLKAIQLFSQAGDALGAAHVALARGLADARNKKLDAALGWFAKAAELAEKVGGARAVQVREIAREDAAQTLVMLGQSEDVAHKAAAQGVSDLIARQQSLQQAFSSYEAGLSSYNLKNWSGARENFLASRKVFEQVQEPQYARRAQVAAAWAAYNQAVALPPASALSTWSQLVQEVVPLEEPELYARTYGASVMASVAAGKTDLRDRLNECLRLSEGLGLADVSSRCHQALAESPGKLEDRAIHAKAAFAQNPSEAVGVYALYSVAVDAYNEGRNELALELALLARPKANSLAKALDQIIAGAK